MTKNNMNLKRSENENLVTMQNTERKKLDIYITNAMIKLGVPSHLKGYNYIREAVSICVIENNSMVSVTKLIYPQIAARYAENNQRIERAIRNAIEISWKRGNENVFWEYFGYAPLRDENGNPTKEKPTNGEFIARLSDIARLDESWRQ